MTPHRGGDAAADAYAPHTHTELSPRSGDTLPGTRLVIWLLLGCLTFALTGLVISAWAPGI